MFAKNYDEVKRALVAKMNFHHRSVSGRWETNTESGRIEYVVRSYGTKVATFTDQGGAVVPDVFYSRTTSRHQNLARAYLPEAERAAA